MNPTEAAKQVADDVHEFVRDHLVPGSIMSLVELSTLVQAKVTEAIVSTHGKFNCRDCGEAVDVEKVRCGDCVKEATR
jgi:hypothetical protein